MQKNKSTAGRKRKRRSINKADHGTTSSRRKLPQKRTFPVNYAQAIKQVYNQDGALLKSEIYFSFLPGRSPGETGLIHFIRYKYFLESITRRVQTVKLLLMSAAQELSLI